MFKNRTVSGLSMAVFLMMTGMGMIVAILPQKIIDQTGSGDSVGFLTSAFALSYIFFQLPISSLADKIGVKPLLVGGYCICGCAGVLYYVAPTPFFILLGRFIQGFGEIPVWALAPAAVSMEFSGIKARAIGVYTAVLHLGLATGPVLGVMLNRILPGDQIFLAYAVFCLAGATVVQLMVKGKTTRTRVEKIHLIKNIQLAVHMVLSRRIVSVTLMGILFYGAFYGAFITVIPVFLIKTKQFSPSTLGIFFSLFYISICMSQLLTGPLSDTYGRMKFMVTGLILAATGFAAFPFFDSWMTIVILGLTSLGFGSFYLSSLAYLNEMVPHSQRGTISGIYFLFWGIGYFSGPIIISWIERYSGSGHGFFSFSFLIAGVAVLLKGRSTGGKN